MPSCIARLMRDGISSRVLNSWLVPFLLCHVPFHKLRTLSDGGSAVGHHSPLWSVGDIFLTLAAQHWCNVFCVGGSHLCGARSFPGTPYSCGESLWAWDWLIRQLTAGDFKWRATDVKRHQGHWRFHSGGSEGTSWQHPLSRGSRGIESSWGSQLPM